MTRQSSMQSTDPRIHTSHCRCRNCQPVRLAGDPPNFGQAKGWGQFLPDAPAALLMLAIGIPALITHLILFS